MSTKAQEDIVIPVANQLAAYNKRDIDAFIVNFDPECVIEDAEGNVIERGRYFIYAMYQKLFEESPALHCHLASRIVLSEYVIDEERVTGRAGSTDEIHVVAIYKIKDALITNVRFLK